MSFTHQLAQLSGVPGERLRDPQGLAALLLAAANAAGLNPTEPPAQRRGPHGIGVAVICPNGHVALYTAPDEGQCCAAVGGFAPVQPQRGIAVIVKRLAPREVRHEGRAGEPRAMVE